MRTRALALASLATLALAAAPTHARAQQPAVSARANAQPRAVSALAVPFPFALPGEGTSASLFPPLPGGRGGQGGEGRLFAQAAQPAAKPAESAATTTPDISGVWLGRFMPHLAPNPPLLPEAAAIVKTRKPEDDPMAVCVPPGVPRVMNTAFPLEILQTPGRVTILLEYDHFVRRIYTDGRGHQADADATWMGDSIGRWEGDTLVVETVNIDDRTWLDERGLPHSDQLKVIERFRKSADGKTLSHEITLDDPKMYAQPWKATKTYIAKPDMRIMEFVCSKP